MKKQQLKICMVTTFYPPHYFGGDGIYIQQLAHALRKLGHHVEILYNPFAFKLLSKKLYVNDYQSGTIPLSGSLVNTIFMQQTGHPVLQNTHIKKILEQDWDVINYHNTSLIGGPKILSYGNAIKLYTIHEYWLLCPMHLLLKNGRKICKKKSCTSCSLLQGKPPQFWRYTNAVQKNIQYIDQFISPSQFSAELHQRKGIDQNFTVIPSFVAEQELAEKKDGAKYFLYVGRLERLKGLQEIIPIFRNRPEYTLKIIGSGSFENKLKNMAAGAPNIEFLGYKTRKELTAWYRNAQALILPSICYEISGLVILEAFQQKTPALVRDLGGMPELVKDNDAGVVFNTQKEFENALDKLSDNSTSEKMGLNGHHALKRKHNEQTHIEKYLDLINRIHDQRHHSGLQ